MSCGKCNKTVSATSDMILCSGFCGLEFHYECCGVVKDTRVDRTAMNAIRMYENILYFCGNCKELLRNYSFISLINKIASVSEHIPNTNNIVAEVSDVVKKCIKGELNAHLKPLKHSDQRETKQTIQAPVLNLQTSDPSSSSFNGSQLNLANQYQVQNSTICGSSTKSTTAAIRTVPQKYWLHLSRFDPQTTDEDIMSLVKECLNTSNATVVKLVPKGMDASYLEFISFKVGINEEKKLEALKPDNWPTGMYIRPFIEKQPIFQSLHRSQLNRQQKNSVTVPS